MANNVYTEDDVLALEVARSVLSIEQGLPAVLVGLVMNFFKWDWPLVGDKVAALDHKGEWWHAVVTQRTLLAATIHYLGWPSERFDEAVPRRLNYLNNVDGPFICWGTCEKTGN